MKLKLYDCGRNVADHLTAVIDDTDAYLVSDDPGHPQGVCSYWGKLVKERIVNDGWRTYEVEGKEVDPSNFPDVVKWAEKLEKGAP